MRLSQSAEKSASAPGRRRGRSVERLADEGGDQQRLRLGGRNAARHQVEELVVVEVARGRAMAAHHVVGEDLEFRLGVELRRLRQQQRVAGLLAVGLLGVAPDDDLALEDAAGVVVHHALEEFAAGAARHLVVDHETRVGVLVAAEQIGAGDLRVGACR